MKATHTIIISCLLLMVQASFAQNARFPSSGIIEYEKSVNMFALMKKNVDESSGNFWRDMYDNYRRSQPQFKILKSSLTFSGDKTYFVPIADTDNQRGFFGGDPIVSQNNTIYTDLATGNFTSQKSVYEETFILKDSLRKIDWKLTSEMRTIAGYECRRANALILDSIYVVAFYTDKIPVSGGPESFTGLPGMIMGIALPHEHVTWFAKTVTDRSVSPSEIKIPAKGKPTNYKNFKETINAALKDWGNYAKSALKAFSI